MRIDDIKRRVLGNHPWSGVVALHKNAYITQGEVLIMGETG
ncbi:hypothetical protein [Mesorhizobium sp. STM 4661]|nr:hypothetical protein [Mesorhizobium sp. STM 4661]